MHDVVTQYVISSKRCTYKKPSIGLCMLRSCMVIFQLGLILIMHAKDIAHGKLWFDDECHHALSTTNKTDVMINSRMVTD